MAEKAEKKPEAAPDKAAAEKKDDGHGAKAAGGGGMGAMLTKLPVLLGGVMIIEAVVLFAGFKFLGGGAPRSAAGAELVAEEGGHGEEAADAKEEEHGEAKAEGGHGESGGGGHGDAKDAKPKIDKKATIEIEVLSMKAPNKISGRTFLYDVS